MRGDLCRQTGDEKVVLDRGGISVTKERAKPMHMQRGGLVQGRQESSATLLDDAFLQESLRRIVAGFTRIEALQEDLMQESLVHLWKVQCDNPGRTKSWYLQNCRFHVRLLDRALLGESKLRPAAMDRP